MSRDIVKPTIDGENELHPAWVLIGASRVQQSAPGAVLFDSDVRHQHYIVVTLKRAMRRRDLSHDWKFGRDELFQVALSEAQWASFVSSMNTGDGVPGTLLWDGTQPDYASRQVPGMPHDPRLKVTMQETHDAANEAIAKVRAAFDAYKTRKTVGNLRDLEIAISHVTPNIDYVTKTLVEHGENVVQRARADVEAFVIAKARQLGIDPADVGVTLELEAGDGDA